MCLPLLCDGYEIQAQQISDSVFDSALELFDGTPAKGSSSSNRTSKNHWKYVLICAILRKGMAFFWGDCVPKPFCRQPLFGNSSARSIPIQFKHPTHQAANSLEMRGFFVDHLSRTRPPPEVLTMPMNTEVQIWQSPRGPPMRKVILTESPPSPIEIDENAGIGTRILATARAMPEPSRDRTDSVHISQKNISAILFGKVEIACTTKQLPFYDPFVCKCFRAKMRSHIGNRR